MHGVKNAKAVYQQQFRGTIAVDDNGNQVTSGTDTTRWIFVETKGDEPLVVDTVSFYGLLYTTSISSMNSKPVILGKRKANGEEVVLQPLKGNTLWKIDLNSTGISLKENEKKIRLSVIKNEKRYWIDVGTVIEIEPEIRG